MSGISPPSSRSVVEAEQLTKLNQLLRALIPTNPFYAAKLRNAGIQPPLSGLAEFVTKTPFTTKQELIADQANNPPFGTNLTFSLDRYTRLSQTSATTGQPLRWLDTNESWNWMVDNWIEIHRAAGVKNGDRVYFAFSFGPFIGFWLAFEAAVRLGCLCIPGGGLTSVTATGPVVVISLLSMVTVFGVCDASAVKLAPLYWPLVNVPPLTVPN